MSPNMANSAIHPLGVDKWVVSWSQAFAKCICMIAPPGECLRVKADMVLFAGNTVWSISERVRGVRGMRYTNRHLYLYLHVFPAFHTHLLSVTNARGHIWQIWCSYSQCAVCSWDMLIYTAEKSCWSVCVIQVVTVSARPATIDGADVYMCLYTQQCQYCDTFLL